jgi:hypothetical protein
MCWLLGELLGQGRQLRWSLARGLIQDLGYPFSSVLSSGRDEPASGGRASSFDLRFPCRQPRSYHLKRVGGGGHGLEAGVSGPGQLSGTAVLVGLGSGDKRGLKETEVLGLAQKLRPLVGS